MRQSEKKSVNNSTENKIFMFYKNIFRLFIIILLYRLGKLNNVDGEFFPLLKIFLLINVFYLNEDEENLDKLLARN